MTYILGLRFFKKKIFILLLFTYICSMKQKNKATSPIVKILYKGEEIFNSSKNVGSSDGSIILVETLKFFIQREGLTKIKNLVNTKSNPDDKGHVLISFDKQDFGLKDRKSCTHSIDINGQPLWVVTNSAAEKKIIKLKKITLPNYEIITEKILKSELSELLKKQSTDPITKTPTITQSITLTVKNPLGGLEDSSAICLLGQSGVGKSFRAKKTLKTENHVILTLEDNRAYQDSFLLTFDCREKYYIPTKFFEHLIKASKDPKNCYTVLIEEAYGFVNKFPDIRQLLSKKRNDGVRYITVEKDIEVILKQHNLTINDEGVFIVPDNFGILMTSSRDTQTLLCNNEDIFKRIDFIEITTDDRDSEEFSFDYLIKKLRND